MNTKRCLVVPGTFLPYNDVTTQLVYKTLRLLPLKYEVCALAGNKPDASFEKKLEQDANYSKFHVSFPYRDNDIRFSIHNPNLFKGLRNMQRYIDTAISMYTGQEYLFTASFPCYTTRVGVALKKQNPNLKWIASFSDPLNHSPYKYDQKTIDSYWFLERWCFYLYCKYYVVDDDEANALEQADCLLFICEEQRDFMIEQYVKYYNHVSEKEIREKCIIVPLSSLEEWKPKLQFVKKQNDIFVLAHFGRIYGLRVIEEFIYALNLFVKEHPSVSFQIEQYGEFRKSDLKLIKQLHLESYFLIHDKYSYDVGYQKMAEADAVLLFDTIMPEDQIQPYLPSKVVEYSMLHKNVLAVTTSKSPVYRIMKGTNSVVCKYNREDIKNGLEEIIIHKKVSPIQYTYTNEEAVKDLLQWIAAQS